jgi:Spy/CpxP family protein refolding chaperone
MSSRRHGAGLLTAVDPRAVDGATEQDVIAAAAEEAEAKAVRGRLRTVMLFRIMRVLTPGQRAKLDQVLDLSRTDDPRVLP